MHDEFENTKKQGKKHKIELENKIKELEN